ncbi:MAG: PilZ domain-containing protein [Vicinamibacterales bacterium]
MSDVSDRRRVPRTGIVDTEFSVLASPNTVRLVDISLSGVLLESSHPVELGVTGTLRLNFSGVPFSADVRVERVSPILASTGKAVFSIAATFVALNRQGQDVIERFADL